METRIEQVKGVLSNLALKYPKVRWIIGNHAELGFIAIHYHLDNLSFRYIMPNTVEIDTLEILMDLNLSKLMNTTL